MSAFARLDVQEKLVAIVQDFGKISLII